MLPICFQTKPVCPVPPPPPVRVCVHPFARPLLRVWQVVQKLMPEAQYSCLENLLNDLISNSNMEKTFLFDVVSKIYIATDSNPVRWYGYRTRRGSARPKLGRTLWWWS